MATDEFSTSFVKLYNFRCHYHYHYLSKESSVRRVATGGSTQRNVIDVINYQHIVVLF